MGEKTTKAIEVSRITYPRSNKQSCKMCAKVVIACAQSQNFKFPAIDLPFVRIRGSEKMKGGLRIGDYNLRWSQAVKRLLTINKRTEFFGWMKRFGYPLSPFSLPLNTKDKPNL
jgi:hypothetical protein